MNTISPSCIREKPIAPQIRNYYLLSLEFVLSCNVTVAYIICL